VATPPPATIKPGEDVYGWILDILNWLNAHIPYFPYIAVGLFIFAVVTIVRAYAGKFRADASLRRAAEDATKARELAEAALEVATTDIARLGLILQIASTSLMRRDRIDNGPPDGKPQPVPTDGVRNLCEWIPQALKLEQADLNKISVWQPSEDGTELVVAEFNGLNPEHARTLRLPIHPDCDDHDSFVARAFRNERIEICGDTQQDKRYVQLPEGPPTYAYRSIIAVPIWRGPKVVGVYTIDSREVNRFREDDKASMEEYALYGQLLSLFVPIKLDVTGNTPNGGKENSPPVGGHERNGVGKESE
jgi:putative methionine-R-sulfoxide reductase with GAF domain